VKIKAAQFLFLSIALGACTSATQTHTPELSRQSALPLEVDAATISSLKLHSKLSVLNFYRTVQWKMVWADSFSLNADADSLINFIAQSEKNGLSPTDYHFAELQSLRDDHFNHDVAMELDALLTDSFFLLWYHLKNGRLDRKTFSRIKLDSVVMKGAIQQLRESLSNHSVSSILRSREPSHKMFQRTKSALAKMLIHDPADTMVLKKRNQLIANLERWRLEPEVPKRYIAVNVPSYTLRVVEDDSTILESRVIIGKPETPTPNIKSVISSFIIYPYWHVPRSILKEILPSVQQDTNYLRKHNYQVIDSQGSVIKNSQIEFKKYTAEDFPYILRQREGAENTMGVIKFVFPNNYGVYLHDTNARRLFSRPDRALSHGCIRVQKAVELAKYLAKDDDTYVDAADLEQYLAVRKKLEVRVVRPIPVHLNYFTVEQRGDSIVLLEDLYKKDSAMIDSLNGGKVQARLSNF
jgi:L,D-transpeptidase YcbB